MPEVKEESPVLEEIILRLDAAGRIILSGLPVSVGKYAVTYQDSNGLKEGVYHLAFLPQWLSSDSDPDILIRATNPSELEIKEHIEKNTLIALLINGKYEGAPGAWYIEFVTPATAAPGGVYKTNIYFIAGGQTVAKERQALFIKRA